MIKVSPVACAVCRVVGSVELYLVHCSNRTLGCTVQKHHLTKISCFVAPSVSYLSDNPGSRSSSMPLV